MNHLAQPPRRAVRVPLAALLVRIVRTCRRLGAVGVVTCIAVAVGACTTSDSPSTPAAPNTTPPLNAPTSAPAASPSSRTLSPEQAESRAQAAVEDYLALFDEISADPDREVAELEAVASGRALDWATHQITSWRQAGHTGVGAQVASDFMVTAVDLDPDSANEDSYPSVELTACVDLSDADLVDENGESVLPSGSPDRVLVDYVVADLGWPREEQWRVIGDDAQLTDSDPPEFVPCP